MPGAEVRSRTSWVCLQPAQQTADDAARVDRGLPRTSSCSSSAAKAVSARPRRRPPWRCGWPVPNRAGPCCCFPPTRHTRSATRSASRLAIGPRSIRRGPRNLHVRELDAAAALASRRAGIEAALNEIGAAFGAGARPRGGWARGGELMELAPPGSTSCSASFRSSRRANDIRSSSWTRRRPGHALRLLEMPDAAREWVQVLLRVLLKYRSLVRPGQLAAELVDLSKSIRSLQELLHNPRDTRFIVVTRAAALPGSRPSGCSRRLRRLRLAAPAVVLNAMTLAPGRCPQVPRDRRRRTARARAAARAAGGSALSSRPRSRRRRLEGRARSNAGRRVDRERSPKAS